MSGSGLGLSIVQEVAADHGRTVSAASRPGGGAVIGFTVAADGFLTGIETATSGQLVHLAEHRGKQAAGRTSMTAKPPTRSSESTAVRDPSRPSAHRFRPGARVAHLVVTAFVVALLTAELVLVTPSVVSAAGSLTQSSLAWVAVAAVATVASMVAFARMRQRMLRAAGIRVPLARSVAVSYAAGALNTTMPGAGVVSTAYTFRRIRDWGAPTAVATWCIAVTGLLATAALSVVGATGVILGGGSTGSLLQSAAEVTAVLLVMAGIAYLISNPDRLAGSAGWTLRWANRLRGRPAETGYAALSRLIDDLGVIRPSRRSWLDAWTLSLLNWVLDVACLAACCAAFGVQVSLPALLITYTAGMAATSLTPLPGGLGVVEAALLLGLTTAGAPWKAALAAVVVYRLLSVGSVALVGWGLIGARRLTRAAPRVEPVIGSLVVDPPVVRAPDPAPAGPNPTPPVQLETATRAKDVMTTDPDFVVPGDSWQRVARTMRALRASTVPVCDEHGELRGIVDYRDIGLRCLSEGGSDATAASLALDPLVTAAPNDRIEDVADLMAKRRAWLAPVLDGQRLIGVIHYADIVTGSLGSAVGGPVGSAVGGPASRSEGTDRTAVTDRRPPSNRQVPAPPPLPVAA